MPGSNSADGRAEAQDHPVLFQQFFKSGSRTYAAQVKQASNGKPFLVLTEGKRDPKTNDVKKSRLFVFSEDWTEFFHLLQETASFLRPLRQQMKDGIPPAGLATSPALPKTALQPPAIAMKPPLPRPTPATSSGTGKTISPPARSVAVVSVVRAMPPRPVSTRPISRPVAAGRPAPVSCVSAKNAGPRR